MVKQLLLVSSCVSSHARLCRAQTKTNKREASVSLVLKCSLLRLILKLFSDAIHHLSQQARFAYEWWERRWLDFVAQSSSTLLTIGYWCDLTKSEFFLTMFYYRSFGAVTYWRINYAMKELKSCTYDDNFFSFHRVLFVNFVRFFSLSSYFNCEILRHLRFTVIYRTSFALLVSRLVSGMKASCRILDAILQLSCT